jgi:hypothetical protein
MLPEVALLEIFHFYVDEEEWYTLVHVCRKWRNVVFGSPRRLNLRLFCTDTTPVREMLDIWPCLPIEVWDGRDEALDMDNIFAALEHNDRICDLELTYYNPSLGLEKVLPVMQQPFPKLTSLRLGLKQRQSNPIRSWVDLHPVCDHSPCTPFHFRDYLNFFCLPLTSFIFILGGFQILDTFLPRRWSLGSPC